MSCFIMEVDVNEKMKLYGFNNLTKTLSFNIYDVCYAKSEREQRDYIAYINPTKQKLVLSDYSTFRHEVDPSRESLKALKEYLEKEESL